MYEGESNIYKGDFFHIIKKNVVLVVMAVMISCLQSKNLVSFYFHILIFLVASIVNKQKAP